MLILSTEVLPDRLRRQGCTCDGSSEEVGDWQENFGSRSPRRQYVSPYLRHSTVLTRL